MTELLKEKPKEKVDFAPGGAASKQVLSWWAPLQGYECRWQDEGKQWWPTPSDHDIDGQLRAERAMLRRCYDLSEVVLMRAYQRLRQRWCEHFFDPAGKPHSEQALATLARVLVEVKTPETSLTLGEAMASRAKDSDRPLVAESRLQRILNVQTHDQLLDEMLRVVSLLRNQAHLRSLAEFIYYWHPGASGDRARSKLANDYYLALLGRSRAE